MTETPTNVVQALAAVMRDMPGIGKNQQASAQQGGYAYRGIEAITVEVQPLLGKYGVVFAPEVLEEATEHLTVNGKPWTDTRLKVRYSVYGPGGLDDRITVGPILAIGRDNSDKGANKCMTQAFKYALLQVLCIGDAKDDPDGTTHATDSRQAEPSAPAVDYATPTQINAIKDACKGLTDEQRAELVDWPTVYGVTLVKDRAIAVTATQADDVLTSLKAAAVGQQEPVETVQDYATAGQEPF